MPGAERVDATFEHLGVLWWIDGDEDLDSSLELEFRPLGAATWLAGAPAIRAYPDLEVNRAPLGLIFADGFESGDTSGWSANVP